MLRSGLLRATQRSTAPLLSKPLACRSVQKRQAHAVSNPTLANIEQRWESMPPQEQAELWMALRDRMRVDWKEMTLQEKKAAYWIAFGPHGPRAGTPPGENWQVFKYTMYGLVVSGVVFWITRLFAKPPPRTMSEEWQKASNEYLKSQNSEPITGLSSKDYKGKGMIQSKPAGKPIEGLDE